jgi:hypothetical protein
VTKVFQLAEFNFGTLKYDWDVPRLADFQNNLDLVNGLAAKADGFVWRMPDDDMEAAQTDMQGVFANPRTASTLSVWRDVDSLSAFVWKTVHKRFYDRKGEWYDPKGNGNFVMWWVPVGHKPSVPEGMDRFNHMKLHGESDFAFGWSYAQQT